MNLFDICEPKNQFYPTPDNLIDKMLLKIDFNKINTILEPNAGTGNILDAINRKIKSNWDLRHNKYDIDAIEIDHNFQHILRGNKHRIVHDDFLTFDTLKHYDLIIMNPPFANGEEHLLKAMKMQESGGNIICILNAQTLHNPYSLTRKDLLRKLNDLNENVEISYHDNAFLDSERKTAVKIALIKITIPLTKLNSVFIDGLKAEERYKQENNVNYIAKSELIDNIVDQYKMEVKAGIKLINEYNAMLPYIQNHYDPNYEYSKPIIKLEIEHGEHNNSDINNYVRQVRMKYWQALFAKPEFTNLFTSELQTIYHNMVEDFINYDFSAYNINQIKNRIMAQLSTSVEDTIIKLFDEFSHKYHWMNETSKNIHYYNGWKTNKSWKINKKIILLLNGYSRYSPGNFDPDNYETGRKIRDIEKVFNYLNTEDTDHIDLVRALKYAKINEQTNKIKTKYFNLTFYKKGTCHIEITNDRLLKKFNIFGSQRKGWLPPNYAKSKYTDMTAEEKSVIDEFEGEAEYNKTLINKDYYITQNSQLLLNCA